MIRSENKGCLLTDFQVLLPRFQLKQQDCLSWLFDIHVMTEEKKNGLGAASKVRTLRSEKNFQRYFVRPNHVDTRWVDVPDFTSRDWMNHEIYAFPTPSPRKGILERTQFFSRRAFDVFKQFFPSTVVPPEHLIHVTCTGYCSPSAAQKLVAQHHWLDRPKITHAYQMGCYAALSSIRIAEGLVLNSKYSKKVDLVHTEICSLHVNPTNHEPEQIIVQSLFADGYIKYSAIEADDSKHGLLMLEHAEQMIPNTSDEMTWTPEAWGMSMTLSKTVPRSIALHLRSFVKHLFSEAKLSWDQTLREGIFALHPGGPKIIDEIQNLLELQEWQIQASRKILFQRGNMSSATLPHIWSEILNQEITKGTKVVSLAFGPGLSILGAVFEVV